MFSKEGKIRFLHAKLIQVFEDPSYISSFDALRDLVAGDVAD
jgi:hypothetical protein